VKNCIEIVEFSALRFQRSAFSQTSRKLASKVVIREAKDDGLADGFHQMVFTKRSTLYRWPDSNRHALTGYGFSYRYSFRYQLCQTSSKLFVVWTMPSSCDISPSKVV